MCSVPLRTVTRRDVVTRGGPTEDLSFLLFQEPGPQSLPGDVLLLLELIHRVRMIVSLKFFCLFFRPNFHHSLSGVGVKALRGRDNYTT